MAALLGAAILVGLLMPGRIWARWPDLCLFHRWTGLPCPSCGLTRSWVALLHGHLGRALACHALGPALLLGLLLALAWPADRPWPGRGWFAAGAAVWAGYTLLRMAGCFPWPPR